jgi:hypothetical protein
MPKYRRRATLQEGHRLDINELRRLGVRMGQYGVTFPRDRAPATLTAHMDEDGRSWLRVQVPPNVDQTFTLVPVRRPFGGCQWYFICALSGYRASVLWKPRGANRFACQKYWGRRAAYASQFLTPVDRAHRNIRRIEARLSPVNPHGEDDGCFYRPRGMRQATFERLWEELDRNEDILNERSARVVARLMKYWR